MKSAPKSIQTESQSVLINIRKIVKALRQASKVSEKNSGLSAAQLFVLQKLAESAAPLSLNELAERTLTHQSSASVVVTKLVKKKLVERLPSKADARAVELHLSKKGAALLEGKPPMIQERLLDGIRKLSPQERQGLVSGLNALIIKAGLQAEEPSLFFEESQ